MPMNANDIEKLIKAGIPDAEVTIRDLAGDGDHYAATVLAESFRGKSRVQQHQLVYNALKGQMGGALHALALQTGLPEHKRRQDGSATQQGNDFPNGVETLSPEGAIAPTGTWSVGARAGDFVFVAGMRGIDPATNVLVAGR